MHQFKKDDIIKVSKDDEYTLGKVADITETEIAIFRDSGDVWYSLAEWDIEFLGVAS